VPGRASVAPATIMPAMTVPAMIMPTPIMQAVVMPAVTTPATAPPATIVPATADADIGATIIRRAAPAPVAVAMRGIGWISLAGCQHGSQTNRHQTKHDARANLTCHKSLLPSGDANVSATTAVWRLRGVKIVSHHTTW
jgi:hypothetical protein